VALHDLAARITPVRNPVEHLLDLFLFAMTFDTYNARQSLASLHFR
jgi:hypothetical protein